MNVIIYQNILVADLVRPKGYVEGIDPILRMSSYVKTFHSATTVRNGNKVCRKLSFDGPHLNVLFLVPIQT